MRLANDVCRCVGSTCAKKDVCLRYTDVHRTVESPILIFSDFSPLIVEGECPHFITAAIR